MFTWYYLFTSSLRVLTSHCAPNIRVGYGSTVPFIVGFNNTFWKTVLNSSWLFNIKSCAPSISLQKQYANIHVKRPGILKAIGRSVGLYCIIQMSLNDRKNIQPVMLKWDFSSPLGLFQNPGTYLLQTCQTPAWGRGSRFFLFSGYHN